MIIIGTAEQCLEKIIRYDEVGVDQLLCYVQFGDLPHDKVMRNLEILSKEVIPKLEARGHRIEATAKG
jgi:alkanesulfonate monooxygenase SsuD/methylene tetrahydromethanopterin reductase-like flavin-dependent oxidoreductase (luciferase family)